MRIALLIGTIHGDASLRLLETGNPQACNAAFKKLQLEPGPLSELQLWESGSGLAKRKRFAATKEAVAHANAGFRKAAIPEAEIAALREKLVALETENAELRAALAGKPAKTDETEPPAPAQPPVTAQPPAPEAQKPTPAAEAKKKNS